MRPTTVISESIRVSEALCQVGSAASDRRSRAAPLVDYAPEVAEQRRGGGGSVSAANAIMNQDTMSKQRARRGAESDRRRARRSVRGHASLRD